MQFLCKTPLNEICSSAAVHRTKTTEKLCLGLTNRGSQVYMNVQTARVQGHSHVRPHSLLPHCGRSQTYVTSFPLSNMAQEAGR